MEMKQRGREEYKRIREIISKYEYVSFDLFDTLIKRNVYHPTDVFSVVEKAYIRKYGNKGIEDFKELRVSAEQKARHMNHAEICIDDIYIQFGNQYCKNVLERYKTLEMDVEIEITCVNQGMVNIYNECINRGKKVLLISDMYLPRYVIESILNRHNIINYRGLFLSCEIGKTKRTGQIFESVLCGEKINRKLLIHIGDNFVSDFIMPRKKGIKSLYIKKKKIEQNAQNIVFNLLDNYTKSLCTSGMFSEYRKLGISILGPLAYGYAKWLDIAFQKNNYDKVLFFSREGFFIQKAYNMVGRTSILNQCYFYASRQALQVAAICVESDFEKVMESMFLPHYFKLEWLLQKWGIKINENRKKIEKCKISLDEELNKFTILKDKRICKLYDLLKADIIANAIKEKDGLVKYLESNCIEGNIAIVDIGWNGNMQKAFEKILKAFCPQIKSVTGYYLGVFTDTNNYKIQEMNSFIQNADHVKELYIHTVLELLFMAPHGTLLSYCLGSVEENMLNFACFEYEGTETFECVLEVQKGAVDFIQQYEGIGSFLGEQEEYVKFALEKFEKPTYALTKSIGNLEAWEHGWIPMAKPQKIIFYIFKPRMLFKDIIGASWKVGFLKRLLLVPLDYVKLLRLLRRVIEANLRKI